MQLSKEVLLKYHTRAIGPRVILLQNFRRQLYISYICYGPICNLRPAGFEAGHLVVGQLYYRVFVTPSTVSNVSNWVISK